jgi:hypothetical protein
MVMEAVQIETCVTIARVAGGDKVHATTGAKVNTYFNDGITAIPFGSFVEKDGTNSALTYGGFVVDKCNGTRTWTPGTGDTAVSYETAIFDIWEDTTPYMVRFTSTALATTDIIASAATVAEDWSEDTYFYILMKSDTATTVAGDLRFKHAEDALIGTPQVQNIPIMAKDTWYFHQIAIVGATSTRNAVISYGFTQVTGGDWSGVVDVQYIGRGNSPYAMLGICIDDQVSTHANDPTEEYEEGDGMTIAVDGAVNAKLCKGVTAVASQPLYAVPGNGSLHTTAIVSSNRAVTALEDQVTSGGRVAVRI